MHCHELWLESGQFIPFFSHLIKKYLAILLFMALQICVRQSSVPSRIFSKYSINNRVVCTMRPNPLGYARARDLHVLSK